MTLRRWLIRRRFPLLATAALIAFELLSTLWWGPAILHAPHWSLPEDLWGTLVAAQRLLHGNLGGLYTQPTALISFPGAALLLVPLVALLTAIGIPLGPNWALATHPAAWVLAGPYQVAISSVALFAVDDIASRSGVIPRNRALLGFAEAVALWGVAVRWGHPEDPVAVGLFLYGVRDTVLPATRTSRAAWLVGAAIAVQPLVLLALPILLAVIEWRRMAGFLIRAAAPGVMLLGAAAAANWSATLHAVTSQPNSTTVDHPTLWASVAPHLSNGSVAAGPARLVTIVIACGCALALRRRWNVADRDAPVPADELLWWIAIALALRSVFEPVMVAYYFWPVLAVAMAASASVGRRLVATSVAATAVTMAAQGDWHGPWVWWVPIMAGLIVTLAVARPTGIAAGQAATKMQKGCPAGSA